MMNQKEIEAAGREEYALWRKTKDRVNSIKAYMEANATAHIDRLDKAVTSGDPAAMLDVFGPGGGIAGVTKKVGKEAIKKRISSIDDSEPYVIVDSLNNNKIVGRYKYKDANRARARRDKLDLEYGGVRYHTRLEKDLK